MEGCVDFLSAFRVIGWAKGSNGRPAAIDVAIGGRSFATTTADVHRPDVGACGFDLRFDRPLPVGEMAEISIVGKGVICISPVKAAVLPKPVKHRLRVPLYTSPFFDELALEERWDTDRLSRMRTFAEIGLLRIRIERPDFPELARHIMALDYKGEGRIQDAWSTVPEVRALACDPTVLRVLGELYGRDAVPMQTLNFRVGTEQSTHTDTVHFNSQPANFMCGVWIALEPITEDNGPLHYYPGSHKLPIIDLDDIGLLADPALWSTNYELHQEVLRELVRVKGLKKERLLAEPGDAIIWAANLFHGGEPIVRRASTRHSQVTHF